MTIQKYITSAFSFLLFFLPAAASAATVSFQTSPARVGVGDTVRVDVILDSAIPTNAFSGTVVYPKAKLEPIDTSDGNSVVNLWITHPVISTASSSVTFAGITPGGFSGNGGFLFSMLFKAKEAGTANISLSEMKVLRNDGAGGEEPVIAKPSSLTIGPKPLGGYVEPADTVPPEPFTTLIGTDPQVAGGKTYLTFVAVDKASGVDHYAVAESRLPSWTLKFFPLSWYVVPANPYPLLDQNLTSTVYIKAVDRSGNERLSIYPRSHLFTVYEKTALVVILIGVALLW